MTFETSDFRGYLGSDTCVFYVVPSAVHFSLVTLWRKVETYFLQHFGDVDQRNPGHSLWKHLGTGWDSAVGDCANDRAAMQTAGAGCPT